MPFPLYYGRSDSFLILLEVNFYLLSSLLREKITHSKSITDAGLSSNYDTYITILSGSNDTTDPTDHAEGPVKGKNLSFSSCYLQITPLISAFSEI